MNNTMYMQLRCLFALVLFCSLSPTSYAKERQAAPNFKLPSFADTTLSQSALVTHSHNDVLNDSATESITLTHYRGKVVYLDFWASWCQPCLVSMPLLNKLRNKYSASSFEVIAVNLDESPTVAAHFLEKIKIDYPVVHDNSGDVGRLYKVNALPSSFIIDGHGNIVLHHLGFKKMDINFLDAVIDKTIAELQ